MIRSDCFVELEGGVPGVVVKELEEVDEGLVVGGAVGGRGHACHDDVAASGGSTGVVVFLEYPYWVWVLKTSTLGRDQERRQGILK